MPTVSLSYPPKCLDLSAIADGADGQGHLPAAASDPWLPYIPYDQAVQDLNPTRGTINIDPTVCNRPIVGRF